MKRKILVTLLAFCLIASLCVVGAAADGVSCEGGETCDHAAAIGNVHYDSLADAVASVTDSNHVEIDLLKSCSGNGIIIGKANNQLIVDITIDFNGFTYTIAEAPLAGSEGYETQCFQLHKGSTVTMKNGTIIADNSGIKMLIQNYSDLTLDDMNIDATAGTNIIDYVVSNNCGDVLITGNTNITAKDDGHAFDAYYWPGKENNNYPEGVTVTLDENFTGTINGDIEISHDGYGASDSKGNSSVTIKAGTINGNIEQKSNGTVSISNATVNGKVENESDVSGELVIDNARIKGTVANSGTSATTTVTGSTVTGEVTGAVVINSTVAGVPTNTAPKGVVAVVGGKHYTDLETALEETDTEPVTIELVADAPIKTNSTNFVKVTRDTTINGNGHTITITASGYTSSRTKILQFVGADVVLNDVTLDIIGSADGDGSYSGDAIDLYQGANLTAVNSHINISNVAAAFVMQTEGEVLNLDSTIVNVNNVDGNGSQGGEWNIANDSAVTFADCLNHALSTQTLTVKDSVVDINGCGLFGIFGAQIDINSGSKVTVTNCGKNLPNPTGSAAPGYGYISPVQIKASNDSYLKVDSNAVLNVTGNVSTEGPNDTIFFPENAELINNGTINATVNVPADSDMNVVLFMADGRQYDVQVVNDGDSVRMPTLSKSGYTFTGWRVNNSNTIVKGGESYPITANTTFTAVWNMIMIPDTYDIAVDQPAHGTVDVSFSNASQGSVITVTATPDEGYELVYITVDGEPISGNSFVMPDHAVEVSALFAEIGKEVNFVDVSRADWFYDYVQYVAQNGLMEGTTRTAFEPNASMTRAMFWTVLARIDGETITGDAWKTLAQTWAVESGISDGTNADALITREQMVTMLYRYAGSPVTGGMAISEFTDGASVSDYATDAVTWALSEGILTGMGDGILAPQGTATRAQAAAMLMRFVEA